MPSQSSSSAAAAAVQVVVRLRPMNETEKKHGTLPVVTASTQDRTVTVIKGQGSRQIKTSFCFNNVFTAFSSQEEVFEETLKPVVRYVSFYWTIIFKDFVNVSFFECIYLNSFVSSITFLRY